MSGIIRNDYLDIRVAKPVRNTDRVGVGWAYSSKTDIPATYRYEFMTTVDDSGLVWRLEGGVANTDWKLFGVSTSGVTEIEWADLVGLRISGTLEIGDKFRVTDQNDLELAITGKTQDGMCWFELYDVGGNVEIKKIE